MHRAICLYRDGKRLSLFPPAATSDPAAMVIVPRRKAVVRDGDTITVGRVTYDNGDEIYRAALLEFGRIRLVRDQIGQPGRRPARALKARDKAMELDRVRGATPATRTARELLTTAGSESTDLERRLSAFDQVKERARELDAEDRATLLMLEQNLTARVAARGTVHTHGVAYSIGRGGQLVRSLPT